jgi:hypothetical protein
MHEVILISLLTIASSNAQAAWDMVADNEEAAIYAEISSISQSGKLVKMWDITDFKKKAIGVNYSSVKSQREYDCKAKQNRTLTYSTMSKNMAGGLVVNTSNYARQWSPVYPGGIVAVLWKTACAKR